MSIQDERREGRQEGGIGSGEAGREWSRIPSMSYVCCLLAAIYDNKITKGGSGVILKGPEQPPKSLIN